MAVLAIAATILGLGATALDIYAGIEAAEVNAEALAASAQVDAANAILTEKAAREAEQREFRVGARTLGIMKAKTGASGLSDGSFAFILAEQEQETQRRAEAIRVDASAVSRGLTRSAQFKREQAGLVKTAGAISAGAKIVGAVAKNAPAIEKGITNLIGSKDTTVEATG